jgi:membrane protein
MTTASVTSKSKSLFSLAKTAFTGFSDDDCPSMAAALSYYTVFSLPPLLLLILMIAGAVIDPSEARGALGSQVEGLMGPSAGQGVRRILEHAQQPANRGLLPMLFGVGALILGATGAFGQLQAALNKAWEVKPDPNAGGLKNFVVKRLFSFGMVLGLGFLLLVSLALSAALGVFRGALEPMLPGFLSGTVLEALNTGVSLAVITLLFAAMFKVMPDAKVSWRDVWVGGFVTALLFVIGKFLIGLYLGRSNPGAAFGAAGSLALILVWIYYSSMIVLFGAEFTETWAQRRGSGIEPAKGAVRVVKEVHTEPLARDADTSRRRPTPSSSPAIQ